MNGELFPPHSGVDTSRAAAESVVDVAGRLRRVVHAVLVVKGGATCEEVCEWTRLDGNTVRPRLWELERLGQAIKTTEKRPTHSGRMARVYRAA